MSETNMVISKLKNHKIAVSFLLSVFTGINVFLGNVAGIKDSFQKIFIPQKEDAVTRDINSPKEGKYFVHKVNPVVVEVKSADSEFEHNANARFGFSYDYPKTWDRKDPDNNDGNTFTEPNNDLVTFKVWGSWCTDLSPWKNDIEYFIRKEQEYKLISKRESGKFLFEYSKEDGLPVETKEEVPGERIVYEYYNTSFNKKMQVMLVRSVCADREISLCCEAPIEQYAKYEKLFLELGSRLHILKAN